MTLPFKKNVKLAEINEKKHVKMDDLFVCCWLLLVNYRPFWFTGNARLFPIAISKHSISSCVTGENFLRVFK